MPRTEFVADSSTGGVMLGVCSSRYADCCWRGGVLFLAMPPVQPERAGTKVL